MADDTRYSITESTLTGIADAIRTGTGSTGPIPVPNFATLIEEIGSSGFPSNMYYEEGTLYSDTDTIRLYHNKGKVPVVAIAVATNPTISKIAYSQMLHIALKNNVQDSVDYLKAQTYNNYQGRISAITNSNIGAFSADETTASFGARGGSYLWKTGVTYSIILLFEE